MDEERALRGVVKVNNNKISLHLIVHVKYVTFVTFVTFVTCG